MSKAKIGKTECAKNFGQHTEKGSKNPRARECLIRFPDGSERTVFGIRAFCREYGVSMRHLKNRAQTKGFSLLTTGIKE